MPDDSSMNDCSVTIAQLREHVRLFVAEREWEQFHDPKNLAMALGVEVGELMDHFRWVASSSSRALLADPAAAQAIRHELADIFLLLLSFANASGIDLSSAAAEKLAINRRKYPVETARGNATKRKLEG